MDFSVVICNYNYGRFVGAAVSSCLGQDYAPTGFEVVVVDDGSLDESRAVLEPLTEDSRVRAIFQPNRGACAALAEGVRQSHGNYICLLDADDLFLPQKLSRIAQRLEQLSPLPADLFLCHDIQLYDDAARAPTSQSWFEFIQLDRTVQHYAMELAVHSFPFAIPCGQVLSRDLAVRIFDGLPSVDWRYAVDSPLGHCALMTTEIVHLLHEPLAYYRIHGSNDLAMLVDGAYRPRPDWQPRNSQLLRQLEAYVDTLCLDAHERLPRLAYLKGKERRMRSVASTRRFVTPTVSVVVDETETGPNLRAVYESVAAQSQSRLDVTQVCAPESTTPPEALSECLGCVPVRRISPAGIDSIRAGYHASSGDFAVFLASGVRLEKNFLERHLNAHQHGGMVNLTCCDAMLVGPEGDPVGPRTFLPLTRTPGAVDYLPAFSTPLRELRFPPLGACVLRRSRLVDAFFTVPLPVPLERCSAAMPWLLLSFLHCLTGSFRVSEPLTCLVRPGSIGPEPLVSAYFSTLKLEVEARAAALHLYGVYCNGSELFSKFLPQDWHLQFTGWIVAEVGKRSIATLRSIASRATAETAHKALGGFV